MHPTAYNRTEQFVKKYITNNSIVLDIGSQDVNGSLKPLFNHCDYIGLDMQPGKNVDIIADAHKLPFLDNKFDAIVSVSCFEHDICFWETFREICRVTKIGGFIYINAPSQGEYHGYPTDCWRFYKDAAKAFEHWINNFTAYKIAIVEQDISEDGIWKDNTMVFVKMAFNHTDIIKYIIDKNKYSSYLEIGCGNDECFSKIIIDNKIGVDPVSGGNMRMTSDAFFLQNSNKFYSVFIDGLHTEKQALKDIGNSLEILHRGGIIICHDVNPTSKLMQLMPQVTHEWTGDVWKAWVKLRMTCTDLSMFVIDCDYGVGIMKKGNQELLRIEEEQLTYENFEKNRKEWLNLISVNDFFIQYAAK